MSYIQLRFTIYKAQLQQLIGTISQLAIFLYLIMYLALPVFALLGLMVIGIIAQPQTSLDERVIYQASYFFVGFMLVRIQKHAILASHFEHYLNQYPINKKQSLAASIGLTIIASNVFLLAPLGIAFNLPNITAAIEHNYFVVFCITVVLLSFYATFGRAIPWVSLLILPGIVLALSPSELSNNYLNIGWLVILIFELVIAHKKLISIPNIPLVFYWQLIVQYLYHRRAGVIIRVVLVTLIMGMYYYLQTRLNYQLPNYLFVGTLFIVALVLASVQFEIEGFRQEYGFYLSALPSSTIHQRSIEISTTLIPCLALGMTGVINEILVFNHLLLFGQFFIITVLSIIYWRQRFFILPAIYLLFYLLS